MVSLNRSLRYDSNNKYHKFTRSVVITIISLTALVVVWWFLSIVINKTTVPSPAAMWEALTYFMENGDRTTGHTLNEYVVSSFTTFIKGFLVALVVAFPLGLLLGYSNILREFASPAIDVLRPIAPVAWAPVFVVLWGYSLGPLMVVFVGIFFPLLTSVTFGVRKIDPLWYDAAKTLGASQLQIFQKIVIPASIPFLMNGVKIGLGIGWMCIVSAELYASPVGGLGAFIVDQAAANYWPGVYVGIFLVGILGILTVGVADYLHKTLSKRMGMDA